MAEFGEQEVKAFGGEMTAALVPLNTMLSTLGDAESPIDSLTKAINSLASTKTQKSLTS